MPDFSLLVNQRNFFSFTQVQYRSHNFSKMYFLTKNELVSLRGERLANSLIIIFLQASQDMIFLCSEI